MKKLSPQRLLESQVQATKTNVYENSLLNVHSENDGIDHHETGMYENSRPWISAIN